MRKALDLIVFGATGFTGRLVAEHLQRTVGIDAPLRWAMAGRDAGRLAAVRDEIGAPAGLPLRVADAQDRGALRELVGQARAVISTVGPYQLHGKALVEACADAGTDYLDLCGEPGWMAAMIPRLTPPAQASGARVVFSCGFDSIPFDLGVVFLQDASLQRFGRPLARVKGRVRVMKGGFSGGTVASLLATVEQMGRDPALRRTMADPFALTPGFAGPPQPSGDGVVYDEDLHAWSAPFVMAPINTKNVHRTNALRGHPWGTDFVYDERQLTGDGRAGQSRARRMARTAWVQNLMLGLAPTRALLRTFLLPRPGQGPSAPERENGRYELVFSGETDDGRSLQATVSGDRDPGYGSTSKMIAEASRCLIEDVDRRASPGGVWTPGAAMGLALVRRLEARAGLRFHLTEAGMGS
jgi:short subunit dehydrogenase-like uncharacterized protein